MAFDVTIGQYYKADSPIHKLDPRLKIIVMTIFTILTFFAKGVVGNLLIGLAILCVTYLAKVPLITLIKSVKPILFFLAFTAIANLIFVTTGDKLVSFGILNITSDGLYAAVFLSLRFFFLMLAGSLLTFTTTPIELTDAFERLTSPFARFGFPSHELAMVLSIALRFIPILSDEAQKVIRAQTLRGADFTTGSMIDRLKTFTPVMIPLFASAIRHAENLATAMEARCYTGGENRTHYRELSLQRLDWITIGVSLIYAIIFIAMRVLL